jgi:hypothetical protein
LAGKLVVVKGSGMNLQETIAELERQAAQYSQAADALRALLGEPAPAKRGRKAGTKVAGKKRGPRKGRKRGPISEETRAKIAAALKKAHAARKARSAK